MLAPLAGASSTELSAGEACASAGCMLAAAGKDMLEDAAALGTLAPAGCVWHIAQIQSLNFILLCIALAGRGVIRQTLQGG